MKNHSFVAGALLLAAPIVGLVSGCGGGGSLLPTPTSEPTRTPLPTPTAIATDDSVPSALLLVNSESSDGSTFGPVRFYSEKGVDSQTATAYTVTFTDTDYPYRNIRIVLPNPKSINTATTFDLANSGANIVATSMSQGASVPVSWGGAGHSQGRLQIVGFRGGFDGGSAIRYDFEAQNVVLTRQQTGTSQGQSQLKISNSFSGYINYN